MVVNQILDKYLPPTYDRVQFNEKSQMIFGGLVDNRVFVYQ
jgi:hypothetical protein